LFSYLKRHEIIANDQLVQLVTIDERLKVQEESRQTLLYAAGKAFDAINLVKDILVDLAEKVAHLQVMVSNSIYIRSLDPTKDLPVILEDSLGFCLKLPEDWIENWDVSASELVAVSC
jgi:hypothetical protein